MKKTLILLLPLLLLSGCYNYQEMNDLGIITATEINKENDEFKITVQVVNPKKQSDASSANQPAFISYTSTGKTIHEAYRNLIQKTSRKIYAMHMQVLIIKDNLAKENLSEMLDFYFRNVEVRKEFYVLIDTTENNNNDKLLEILTPLTNLSSQNILNTLKSDNKYVSVSNLITFNDLMGTYLDEHKELVLPTIYIKGNEQIGDEETNIEKTSSDSDLHLGNLAIFKDEKMLGILSREESITVNLIKGEAKEMLITFNCNENKFASSKVILDKPKIEIDIKKLQVNIIIKGNADLTEYTCNDNLNNAKVIKEINNKLNKHYVDIINNSIKNINKKYNSDVYGFRNMIYKKDYKYYNQIKDDYYNKVFNNLNFNIKSDINLITKGNLLGGTYEK